MLYEVITKKVTYEEALKKSCIKPYDYITPYVKDLKNVIDMESIKQANMNIA